MIDEATLAQMNGKYVMPPDAGPAWRAAAEYGFDMSLVEDALRQFGASFHSRSMRSGDLLPSGRRSTRRRRSLASARRALFVQMTRQIQKGV